MPPAAFLRTTLPLGIDSIAEPDTGVHRPRRRLSLAAPSPSPHRHQRHGQGAPRSRHAGMLACWHAGMLAQSALTLGHLSSGRFILGLGSGEMENIIAYGFDFAKPVGRFEQALQVRLLWGRCPNRG
ncbi:MAG TPA: LLM class flavin-dependent oxidoreductase [Sphingobium sp.]